MNPSKWKDVYILSLGGDYNVINASELYKIRYRIPDINVENIENLYKKPASKFLSTATRESKLIIIGHGGALAYNNPSYGIYTTQRDNSLVILRANELADLLVKVCGAHEIGIISFKTCFLGIGDFLIDFANCSPARGLRFGWAVAYKNKAIFGIKPNGKISIGAGDHDRKPKKLEDVERIKVVRGSLLNVVPLHRASNRFNPFDSTSFKYDIKEDNYMLELIGKDLFAAIE